MQSKFKSIKIGFFLSYLISSSDNSKFIRMIFNPFRYIDRSSLRLIKSTIKILQSKIRIFFFIADITCTRILHMEVSQNPCKYGQFKTEYIPRRYIAICRFTSRASAFTIDRRRFLADITSEWSFPRQDTEIQGFPCPGAAILSTHNSAMAAALPKTGRKQDRKIRVDRFVPRTVNASCSFLEPSILGSFRCIVV